MERWESPNTLSSRFRHAGFSTASSRPAPPQAPPGEISSPLCAPSVLCVLRGNLLLFRALCVRSWEPVREFVRASREGTLTDPGKPGQRCNTTTDFGFCRYPTPYDRLRSGECGNP